MWFTVTIWNDKYEFWNNNRVGGGGGMICHWNEIECNIIYQDIRKYRILRSGAEAKPSEAEPEAKPSPRRSRARARAEPEHYFWYLPSIIFGMSLSRIS